EWYSRASSGRMVIWSPPGASFRARLHPKGGAARCRHPRGWSAVHLPPPPHGAGGSHPADARRRLRRAARLPPEALMNRLSQTALMELARFSGEPCLSLYLSTHRYGAEARENPVQLRRLLRVAATRLGELAVAPDAIEAILKPARRWVEEADTWRHPGAGFALFAAPGFFRVFTLDLAP